MRLLLTGSTGQLGRALIAAAPAHLGGQPLELVALGREQLNLADAQACHQAVLNLKPDWILNSGAYTAVDRAESEPALAQAVNAQAPAVMAEALAELGAGCVLQISTDFVFNGAQGTPYRPDQPVQPLGVYGASKAEAERLLLERLGSRAYVLRTGWLYGPVGHNFLTTMLRLQRQRAATGEPLAVVADQVGCPTSTASLASACWRLLNQASAPAGSEVLPRILHWSDAGVASWYDFAVAIANLGQQLGVLERSVEVQPITTADYPTPARRPSYSLLDCATARAALNQQPLHWRAALQGVLQQML